MKSGIYDWPMDRYHADQDAPEPSLSASIAWELLSKTPAHAWIKHPRCPNYEPPEHKDIWDLGSAAHNMVLRQDMWREEIDVIMFPDWRTKAAREAREASRSNGRYPILRHNYDALERMVTVLEAHPVAANAFKGGKPEQSLLWQDERTGIWCRCRPDYTPSLKTPLGNMTTAIWPDYKTTAVNLMKWERSFTLDYGGALRAAHYEAGIRATANCADPILYYVVQERSPPFSIIIRVADPASPFMKIGRAMHRKACDIWAKCLNSDTWPSYDLMGTLTIPQWQETAWSIDYADWME